MFKSFFYTIKTIPFDLGIKKSDKMADAYSRNYDTRHNYFVRKTDANGRVTTKFIVRHINVQRIFGLLDDSGKYLAAGRNPMKPTFTSMDNVRKFVDATNEQLIETDDAIMYLYLGYLSFSNDAIKNAFARVFENDIRDINGVRFMNSYRNARGNDDHLLRSIILSFGSNRNIRIISASNSLLGNDMASLLMYNLPPNLRVLELDNCHGFGNDQMPLLCENMPSSLTFLNISYNQLTRDRLELLADKIESEGTMRHVGTSSHLNAGVTWDAVVGRINDTVDRNENNHIMRSMTLQARCYKLIVEHNRTVRAEKKTAEAMERLNGYRCENITVRNICNLICCGRLRRSRKRVSRDYENDDSLLDISAIPGTMIDICKRKYGRYLTLKSGCKRLRRL
jgi:hypothetical protein